MPTTPPPEPFSKPRLQNILLGESIRIAVTPGCVIASVIHRAGEPAEIKEHDSFMEAVRYIEEDLGLQAGDWKRVDIVNVEEYRHGRH